MKKGFTLIELLVVIAVIATILSLAVPNFLGVRQRARDAKKKAELYELKTALRMYYNDFRMYPDQNVVAYKFNGCGAAGVTACPDTTTCAGSEFAASGTDCATATVYMKRLPRLNANGSIGGYTYRSASDDVFCLYTPLDNAGDSEIAASQSRCSSCGISGNNYVICED